MNCPECDSRVDGSQCRKCGWGRPAEEKAKPSNGLRWWVSPPPYRKPADDELCGEPLEDGSGFCRKSVKQHREEFLAFGERIAKRVVRF